MPELPEVETVRRGLAPIVGQSVEGVMLRRRDVARDLTKRSGDLRRGKINPAALLAGCTLTEIARKGKQLALIGRDDAGAERAVMVHLGMSGQVLLLNAGEDEPRDHAHCVWTLGSGHRVVFRDPRRFGKLVLHGPRGSLERAWDQLGPDGLEITPKTLGAALSGTRRSIKAALLDQKLIAGVGNIYADEALFEARINPQQRACDLSDAQARGLSRSIMTVLKRAIRARGSTLRDYRDSRNRSGEAQRLHRVYGRAGRHCTICQILIVKAQIAQRTTCWCPKCQPIKA